MIQIVRRRTLKISEKRDCASFRAAWPTRSCWTSTSASHSFEPRVTDLNQRLFDAYAAEVARSTRTEMACSRSSKRDVERTSRTGCRTSACSSADVFNRFAVTREINDGLLAPRFAPSQRA